MTVKLYLFCALLGLSVVTQAQTSTSSLTLSKPENRQGTQAVYLGFFGDGLFISANYEIHFKPGQRGWGIHAGIGYTPGYGKVEYFRDSLGTKHAKDGKYADKLTIPFGVNYLIGKKTRPHRLELGVGFTYMNGDSELFDQETTRFTWLLVSKVAYRRFYFNNRLVWRVAFTPVISLNGKEGFACPWLEGSIGIRF